MQDHYKTLGVSVDATHEQIVHAYRELVKQYHPDKLQDNPLKHLAEEKLKEINAAYEILKDPGRRSRYDQQNRGFKYVPPDDDDEEDEESFSNHARYRHYQQYQQQHTRHHGKVCYKHPTSLAVATCQFCGKDLCQACASLFTIVSCPECLSKHNAKYLRDIKVSVWKPVILFVAAALISFFFITHFKIQDSLGLGLYVLGVTWGWDMLKRAAWVTGASFFFGLPIGIGMFLALFLFGWIIGLITGGFKYIKLLLHYRKTARTVTEAEDFIRQYVAA